MGRDQAGGHRDPPPPAAAAGHPPPAHVADHPRQRRTGCRPTGQAGRPCRPCPSHLCQTRDARAGKKDSKGLVKC